MTSTARTLVTANQGKINFTCQWSAGYLVAGAESLGSIELTATTSDEGITVETGQQLVFLDLPSGWAVHSKVTDWEDSSMEFRGSALPALKYVGSRQCMQAACHPFRPPGMMADEASSPLLISAGITAPAMADPMVQVSVQLYDGATAISEQSSLLLSSIAPGDPFVAFANAPGIVLITKPTDTDLPNTLNVTLQNLESAAGGNLKATLSLKALDKDLSPVSIEGALDGVTVSGGGDWPYDPAGHTWSTTIPSIPGNGSVDIVIEGLALSDPTIKLVNAEFTLSPSSGPSKTYQSSAWFGAFGPYSMTLALSTSVAESKFYRLSEPSSGNYAVNALNKDMNAPPLQPSLVNSDNAVVYPPVPGWYSWNGTGPDFPSDYPLSTGENKLHYLVKVGGSLMTLTTSTADYDFAPQEISAAGYQQSYEDAGATKFGPIMPKGAIILWNGAVSGIPAGWTLCDGTNGSPNLAGRFVVAAGGGDVPNSHGDATAHTHNVTYNGTLTTTTAGTHSHLMPSGWYSRNLSCGVHTGVDTNAQNVATTRVQDDGAHSHQVTVAINQNTADTIAPRPAWYALCYIMKL